NARLSVKVSSPEPALLNPPKVPTRLPALPGAVRLAPPTELPVSVAAVIWPAVWLIAPAAAKVTAEPLRLNGRVNVVAPPVEVKERAPVVVRAPPTVIDPPVAARLASALPLPTAPPKVTAPLPAFTVNA